MCLSEPKKELRLFGVFFAHRYTCMCTNFRDNATTALKLWSANDFQTERNKCHISIKLIMSLLFLCSTRDLTTFLYVSFFSRKYHQPSYKSGTERFVTDGRTEIETLALLEARDICDCIKKEESSLLMLKKSEKIRRKVPFLYHVMIGVGSPVASHWKTAVEPSAIEISTGRKTK